MAKIVRKLLSSISRIKCFCWSKSILHHYCIQDVKDEIQVRAYTIDKESITHFSQFI